MTTISYATSSSAVIGGEVIDVGTTFQDIDPGTGAVLAEVARCGPTEINDAVEAARQAQPAWVARSPADRALILRRIAELIRRDSDELTRAESLDTGKPLSQAAADVAVAARYFDYYAGAVEALFGDTVPLGKSVFAYTLLEPHGVTGHIIPWNYPVQMVGRTVAPALAAGNCCVLKPAEEAPLSPGWIARLALEAGLPPGAFNVVPGMGPEAGAALAAHPGLDHLSFTGSTEVGRLVAKAAAENVVPVTVELGGKSPNIVFADADLDRTVPAIVRSIVQHAGQTCSAGSRLLVEESIRDTVVAAVAEQFRLLQLGYGLDDPDVGPLISERQRQRVEELVMQGREQASLIVGGTKPDRPGFFYEPTLLGDVAPELPIAQEEVFGPVLVASTFTDLDEAITLANGTPYGLVAGVWTQDIGRAHRLAAELEVGQVFVNTYGAGGGVELPFGGRKLSGHGREKGFAGLLAYTRAKTVAIAI